VMKRTSITHSAARCGHFLLLLLVCFYPVLPNWLDQRLPSTHEGYRYLLLSDWFRDAIASGVWYPRWLPEMNGGFGYPEFVFYQPAYFFVNTLASLWVEPLFLRQLTALSLIALAGGLGVYCLARRYVEALPALVLTACFQAAPYVHTNLYQRGDLSEWMVLELIPWPVYFLLQFCDRAEANVPRQRVVSWLGLAVSTALLCYCHPVALMFLPPLLLFIGGICLLKGAPTQPLVAWGEMTGAVVMGLVLSAPYWLTVMQMKAYVNVAAVLDGFIAWKNTVGLQHLLFGSLLGGDRFREFFGAPFVVAALVGWWCGRRRPLVFGGGLAYVTILVLVTPVAQQFWKIYPFSLLQFPWRLAVFAPLLQVICLLGFYDASTGRRLKNIWLVGGCCLLVGWTLLGHFGFKPAETAESGLHLTKESLACLRNFAQTGSPASYVSTIDAGEWMPLTAAHIAAVPARGETLSGCAETRRVLSGILAKAGLPDLFARPPLPKPLLEADNREWIVRRNEGHSAFRLDYQLGGASPARITINQLYLPGWKIMVNGTALPSSEIEENRLADGRMQVPLPPGTWRVQALYEGPPGWQMRNWLMTALCGLALLYWAYRWYDTGEGR